MGDIMPRGVQGVEGRCNCREFALPPRHKGKVQLQRVRTAAKADKEWQYHPDRQNIALPPRQATGTTDAKTGGVAAGMRGDSLKEQTYSEGWEGL